jgi:hypothetical protein
MDIGIERGEGGGHRMEHGRRDTEFRIKRSGGGSTTLVWEETRVMVVAV